MQFSFFSLSSCATFKTWCDNRRLKLNSSKIKEMTFDPLGLRTHVTFEGYFIEQVHS